MLRLFRTLIALAALLAVAAPAVASAHGAPVKTIYKQIGPYRLRIDYYSEPRGGQALEFSLTPETPLPGNLRYHVMAIPGTLVDAVPVRARMDPSVYPGGEQHGAVNLPVSGQWLLSIDIQAGPSGPTFGDVPILAGAPPAIPEWLGWLIGLTPAWLLVGFVAWQARSASREMRLAPQ
ncbi:MAG TPA: hypothetical protein VGE07_14380 [Herpetosiphonaceae bacterium]